MTRDDAFPCAQCPAWVQHERCWRDGKPRAGNCRWTLAQQEAWYERNARRAEDDYTVIVMREHIRLRRERERSGLV